MGEKKSLNFTDENNESFEFEIADSFEMDGKKYVALIEPETEDEPDGAEVLIMRMENESDDEDVLVAIEEDDELDKAFTMFRDRCADEYEFSE